MEDLKSCPFCGETPEITKHFKEEIWRLTHRCSVVGAIMLDWSSQNWLSKAWNTRATP